MTRPSSSRPLIVTLPFFIPVIPCLIAFDTISFSTNARMATARDGMTTAQGSTSNVICESRGRRFAFATPTIFRATSSTRASLTSSCESKSCVAANPCTRFTLSARILRTSADLVRLRCKERILATVARLFLTR